jgi:hypothetical protein
LSYLINFKYSIFIIVSLTFGFIDKPKAGSESWLNILVWELIPSLHAEAFFATGTAVTLAV